MSIAAVVLAAGASRRLGRPKQMVRLQGETLLARAVRTAREAGMTPVIAVVAGEVIVPEGAVTVFNPYAEEGMASSIRVGVQQAQQAGATGVVVMTCDQVAVTAEHLRALCKAREQVTGSAYAGKVGVPAYFPSAMFAALLRLEGDSGARGLLRDARSIETQALAFDIDTEEDVRAAEAAGY